MPVEISIISGARKGERIQLDSDSFQVGDDSACEVYFNPRKDPSVGGRRALIVFEESGWRIQNTGSGMLLVNQNVVEGPTPLRSGDIIRMSDMGPDMTFTLISGPKDTIASAAEPPESSEEATAATSGQNGTAPPDKTAVEEEQPAATADADKPWSFAPLGVLIGIVAFLVLAVVALLMRPSPPESPDDTTPATDSLELQKIPDRSVNEGEQFTITAQLSQTDSASNDVSFAFEGQVPAGMKIDPNTGEISWTPTEQQGPGEYSVTVRAVAAGQEGDVSDTQTCTITVEEVNEAPTITSIPDQVLDVAQSETLQLAVKASDSDLPQGRLIYALKEGAPDGVRIDSEKGQLSWTPSADQRGRTHRITVSVTDDAPDPRSAEITFQVTVAPDDPWNAVIERHAPTVYLLLAEEPGIRTAFPYGTACAIRSDALLTSAALAVELDKKRRSEWKIWAERPEGGERLPVREIRAHQGFVATDDTPSVEKIYWDLAILVVDGELKSLAALAGPEELRELEPGCQLGCLGIPHQGEPLTRFDNPTVELTRGKLFQRSALATPDGSDPAAAPVLLHMNASLPDNVYGSPIVNQSGNIVGIYAEKAQLPDPQANERLQIHYAPWVTLARAWLAGQGTEYWMAPK